MSKKSRKRNRRLLTALAALGGAAMLAGRGKKPNMDIPDRNRGMMPTGIDKKMTEVYPDAIMRGGSGVKPARVVPRLKVTDRGNVIRDGVDTGVGNMKTKFVGGDGKIFQGGKQVGEAGVTSPGISVRDDGSIMAKGVLYPNRSAYMNRNKMPGNLSSDMGMKRTPVIDDSFFSDAMAKDGGKIVKTETGGKAVRVKKKKGIQVRGFGKARR
tara:strand:- start:267 stop:902 length:636 start_codon:yes stop_codon:yes gene_type:complete